MPGATIPAAFAMTAFVGATQATDFARNIENNKVMLERQRVAIEQARLAMQKKAMQIEAEQQQAALAQRAQEARDQLKLQMTAQQIGVDQFNRQDLRLTTGMANEMERFNKGQQLDRDKIQMARDTALRTEVNALLGNGFRRAAAEDAPADGETTYTDAAGTRYIGPTKAAEELRAAKAKAQTLLEVNRPLIDQKLKAGEARQAQQQSAMAAKSQLQQLEKRYPDIDATIGNYAQDISVLEDALARVNRGELKAKKLDTFKLTSGDKLPRNVNDATAILNDRRQKLARHQAVAARRDRLQAMVDAVVFGPAGATSEDPATDDTMNWLLNGE